MNTKDILCNIIEQGVSDNDGRELLANSLFYYCSGSDATPIIAFGERYPLYIYVDTVQYDNGDFYKATEKLYLRLKEAGFLKTDYVHKEGFDRKNNQSKPIIKRLDLTRWSSMDSGSFNLLYAQGDAPTVYCKLYSDVDRGGHCNWIQPKCVCNYKYEIMPSVEVECLNGNSKGILHHVEKRVEYIMGQANSEHYKKVGEYKYYGDYGGDVIPFFKRLCYYVY
jgi:hypothetical protein